MVDGEWVDEAAGPVVRPYQLTGGRTADDGGDFDLVFLIEATGTRPPAMVLLGPEHESILRLCRSPLSVAEVASHLDLALGVVRVLLGDLLDQGLIVVRRPKPLSGFPGEMVLKEVIDGLQAL